MMNKRRIDDWVVLLVDDVSDYLEVTQIAMGFRGAEVHTAQNIHDAWDQLQSLQPTVILLDMWMPGGDGSLLLARLRNDPRYNHIPVVAVTAYATSQRDKRRLTDLGFDGFVPKPFTVNQLIKYVSDILDSKGGKPMSVATV